MLDDRELFRRKLAPIEWVIWAGIAGVLILAVIGIVFR